MIAASVPDHLSYQQAASNGDFLMNGLAIVFILKISITALCWCLPFICAPTALIEKLGFPRQDTYMYFRMLAWAYLALCVGYGFGLSATLNGERAIGPVWMGIISNVGACAYLAYFGVTGAWSKWKPFPKIYFWSTTLATLFFALGLIIFGL